MALPTGPPARPTPPPAGAVYGGPSTTPPGPPSGPAAGTAGTAGTRPQPPTDPAPAGAVYGGPPPAGRPPTPPGHGGPPATGASPVTSGGERPPRKRRTGLIAGLVAVLLLALATAGVVVVRPGPVAGWLGAAAAEPTASPTTPPEPSPSPVLAALAADAPQPTAAGVKAAIDGLTRSGALGGNANFSVRDVATGEVLFDRGAGTATVPASTMKLVTAATALTALGPTHRLETRVVAGDEPGEVVLIGGGDPTLAVNGKSWFPGVARLDRLAAQVKKSGVTPTKVTVDGSLFSGPTVEPGWDPDIPTGGFAAVTTALMTNLARTNLTRLPNYYATRHTQPDLAAGQQFADLLGLPASAVSRGRAPAEPAEPTGTPSASPRPTAPGTELGVVQSPPLLRMIEFMLVESDNVVAEAIARQVAIAKGEPGSYVGASAAMKTVLGELGLPTAGIVLADGSGLSRTNRLTPELLTALLAMAGGGSRPELTPIFAGLPVAAWSGTLTERFQGSTVRGAVGAVRAKTGSLNRVTAMSGVVSTADGRLLAFAMLSDQVPGGGADPARAVYDRIAAALAGCGCR